MAAINLVRTNEYINLVRDYQIYIDGKKIDTIKNGERKIFNIEEGTHIIEARIDWCGSPKVEVTIKQDEIKTLRVGGFKHAYWIILVMVLYVLINIVLQSVFDFEYASHFMVLPLILMIYILTLGRNKYLSLVVSKTQTEK